MNNHETDSNYKVICTYYVKPGYEEEMESLLKKHWPRLREIELVTEEPPIIYRGKTNEGHFYIEILTWIKDGAAQDAFQDPIVNPIWSRLYEITEDRAGRPAIEYPNIQTLAYAFTTNR